MIHLFNIKNWLGWFKEITLLILRWHRIIHFSYFVLIWIYMRKNVNSVLYHIYYLFHANISLLLNGLYFKCHKSQGWNIFTTMLMKCKILLSVFNSPPKLITTQNYRFSWMNKFRNLDHTMKGNVYITHT